MKKSLVIALAVVSASCAEPTTPSSSTMSSGRAPSASLNAALPASSVLPSAYTSVMGTSNNNFPQSFRNLRYQQVFLGSEVKNPAIVGLCLRRDDVSGGAQTTQTLTVKLGPTSLDYTNFGANFDSNYSDLPVVVFSGDVVIPASVGLGTPIDFDFCIPFTTEYDLPAGSNLIVEVVNTSLVSGNVPRDACSGLADDCTTARAYAFSATATDAYSVERGGLVMKLVSPEPPRPLDPSVKDDCMKGGWANFGFTNQGQCIRFVETGKDSRSGAAAG